jgi:transposase
MDENSAQSRARGKYASISSEKRQSLVNLALCKGESVKRAAGLLDLNYSTAQSVLSKYKREGELIEGQRGGRRVSKVSAALNRRDCRV